MKRKLSAVIELEIRRADGSTESYGPIRNVIGNLGPTSDSRVEVNTSLQFRTHSSPFRVDLAGTFSQSGTTITRESGVASLSIANGHLFVFGTGEQAYKTATIGAGSCTVSRSRSVSTTTLAYYTTASDNQGGNQDLSGQAQTRSYGNGVLAWTLDSPASFPVASTSYTLASIQGYNGSIYSHFDLPSPITINIGDQVIVSSYVLTMTYDDYQPRVFAVSPISGISGTGTIQRLRPVNVRENTTCTRIFLIEDANKLTPIPDMLAPGASVINPASLTILETIVVSGGSPTSASYFNNMTQSSNAAGAVVTGGTIKQIAWGTTTELFGIIEYDTPVTLDPAKVLTVSGAVQMEVETP